MKKIVSLIMCLMMLGEVLPAFADNGGLLVNESFNNYATNLCPENLNIQGRGVYIKNLGENEKALNFSCKNAPKSITFDANAVDKFFISFDISADKSFEGDLVLNDGSANFGILGIRNSAVVTNNGKHIGGINEHMRNVTVILDINKKKMDVNIDGRCVISDFFIAKLIIGYAKTIKFSFSSANEASVLLDNVNCGTMDSLSEKAVYPKSAYSKDAVELVSDEMLVEDTIYVKYLFNAIQNATNNHKNNTIAVVKDAEADNSYLHFESTLSGLTDYHLDMNAQSFESDALVYQLDFRLNNYNSWFNFYFKDANGSLYYPFSVGIGGIVSGCNSSKSVSVGDWHTVAWCIDKYNAIQSLWVDGEKISKDLQFDTKFLIDSISIMRIHVQGKNGKEKFDIDNFTIYGGTEPREINFDPNAITEITLSDKKTAWESDESIKMSLNDFAALHKRSGYLYSNNEKTHFDTVNTDYDTFADIEVLKKISDADYDVASDKSSVTVNASTIQISTELRPETAYISNDRVYIPVKYTAKSILNKKVTCDDSAVSGGLIVIGDTEFNMPEGEALKKLNNFVLYERPDRNKILEDYKKSDVCGVHPRVLATATDFERIKGLIKTDSTMKKWYDRLITQTDKFAKEEPLIYELRDGVRLWYVSMDFIERMSHFGMAYRLTGDIKYAERGYMEMESIAKFQDWHPQHRLDVGGMSVGFAIGYDWLYDTLTDEQRAVIEKGAYKNAFYDYNLFYQSNNSTMETPLSGNNHNAVLHGGAAMMGIAFMDVYPEIASYMVASGIRCNEPMLYNYAPNGAWYEGLSYAAMSAEYEAYLLGSVKKVFGHTYGLEDSDGLCDVGKYFVYMQSPTGAFGFADGGSTVLQYDAGMLWFMNNYGDYATYDAYDKMLSGIIDTNSTMRQLLWYDPSGASKKNQEFSLDKVYDDIDVVTARRGFGDEDAFVAMKGGTTQTDHGHVDMGTFAYYNDGVCWTADYNTENYNLPGYWYMDDRRYRYFRLRAEAHNCLIINPNEASEYSLERVFAKFTDVESKPRGMKAILDMTPQQEKNATSARRGYLFTDNRQTLVVRDEVMLRKQSELCWFFQTYQDVTIDGKSVVITDKTNNTKQIRIDFATSGDYELSTGIAEPLPTSPHPDGLTPNTGSTRIMLKMAAPQGAATITARISPADNSMSDVNMYNIPIDSWTIPDGEIPEKPRLDTLVIGGTSYDCGKYNIRYLNDNVDNIPEVAAQSGKYNVDIAKAPTKDTVAIITLTDPNDATNKSVYKILNYSLPYKKTGYPNVTEYRIYDITASEEPQIENPLLSSIDRDLSTRWSAEGSQWVTIDIGSEKTIDTVIMAFMSGVTRQYSLNIEVSNDGVEFTEVFSGKSSGTTNDYDAITFAPVNARYVKINGYGSNENNWNSWTELAVAKQN